MKKLFLLALAACSFVSCDKGEEIPAPETFDVISFEAAEKMVDLQTGKTLVLKDLPIKELWGVGEYTFRNVLCGKDYVSVAEKKNFDAPLFATADASVKFSSYYAWEYDAWGGISLAQLPDMKAAAPLLSQQFSVWAEGGANATPTYAVCYDSNSPSEEFGGLSESGYPTFSLTAPRVIDHLYIANSTYVYNFFTEDNTSRYQVKITGWLKGVEKGSTIETLVDGETKLAGWRKVSLASFGEVDKVVFKVLCDYMTDPTYFCIDEITLKETVN